MSAYFDFGCAESLGRCRVFAQGKCCGGGSGVGLGKGGVVRGEKRGCGRREEGGNFTALTTPAPPPPLGLRVSITQWGRWLSGSWTLHFLDNFRFRILSSFQFLNKFLSSPPSVECGGVKKSPPVA